MFRGNNTSKTTIIASCLPHGLLFIVFFAVDLQVVVVNSHPLSIPDGGIGAKLDQNPTIPHSSEANNPDASIGALNAGALNSSSLDLSGDNLLAFAEKTSETTDDESHQGEQQHFSNNDDNATTPLVDDPEDRLDENFSNVVTSPRIEVVSSKTISDNTNQHQEPQVAVANILEDSPAVISQYAGNSNLIETNDEKQEKPDGQSLVSGEENNTVQATSPDMDMFDNLMSSIHDHWTDFVAKMKMSVVDVWKSISTHMMDRLESFAYTL